MGILLQSPVLYEPASTYILLRCTLLLTDTYCYNITHFNLQFEPFFSDLHLYALPCVRNHVLWAFV